MTYKMFIDPAAPGGKDLWSDIEMPAMPLGALDRPEMAPPSLSVFATVAAPALMSWFDGAVEISGFSAHWFRASELTLYYVEGPKNGPPLLLFPGQQQTWLSYRPVLDELSKHFHIFIMELRGHGYSQRSVPGNYNVLDYVDDAVEFIEHVIGEPAIISGHSLGGMMVMALAGLHPHWVSGASIEDAPFFTVDPANYLTRYNWLDEASFAPVRAASRAFQMDGASLESIAEHRAGSRPMLPPVELLPEPTDRQYFVDWLMGQELGKAYKSLPQDKRSVFDPAWRRYVDSGDVTVFGDYIPQFFLEIDTPIWLKTDWRTSCSQPAGQWTSGWDEREALSKIKAPTVFWIADRRLVAIRSDADIKEAEQLLKTVDRPVLLIEAEQSGHYIHVEKSALFIRTLTDFFG